MHAPTESRATYGSSQSEVIYGGARTAGSKPIRPTRSKRQITHAVGRHTDHFFTEIFV